MSVFVIGRYFQPGVCSKAEFGTNETVCCGVSVCASLCSWILLGTDYIIPVRWYACNLTLSSHFEFNTGALKVTRGCSSAICERLSTFHNDARGGSVEPSLNFIGLVGTSSTSRVSGGVSRCQTCPSETGVQLGDMLTFSRESHLLVAVDCAAVRSMLLGAVMPKVPVGAAPCCTFVMIRPRVVAPVVTVYVKYTVNTLYIGDARLLCSLTVLNFSCVHVCFILWCVLLYLTALNLCMYVCFILHLWSCGCSLSAS